MTRVRRLDLLEYAESPEDLELFETVPEALDKVVQPFAPEQIGNLESAQGRMRDIREECRVSEGRLAVKGGLDGERSEIRAVHDRRKQGREVLSRRRQLQLRQSCAADHRDHVFQFRFGKNDDVGVQSHALQSVRDELRRGEVDGEPPVAGLFPEPVADVTDHRERNFAHVRQVRKARENVGGGPCSGPGREPEFFDEVAVPWSQRVQENRLRAFSYIQFLRPLGR